MWIVIDDDACCRCTARALRSLTLTLGSTLEVIDLSGSNISDEQFDTLVACASRLRSIIADRCPHIGNGRCCELPMKSWDGSDIACVHSHVPGCCEWLQEACQCSDFLVRYGIP